MLALRSKGFDVCLPLYRPRRISTRGAKEFALFPGYVFCCFDSTSLLPVQTVPGVAGIVCCGRTPEPVDQVEMRAVQQLTASGVISEPYPYLQAGQSVRISEGPLEGVEGLLLRERGADRLVISVSLLQRSVIAEVDRGWVEPAVVNRSALSAHVIDRSIIVGANPVRLEPAVAFKKSAA
jgi:transcription antitermination factor NusG